MQTVGRNERCPCSSGKKYKHCCLPLRGGGRITPTSSGAWATAMAMYEVGQLQQAARLCHQVLQVDAGHVDAWHLLGVIACEAGDTPGALDFLTRATQWKPGFAEAHYHLGLIHMRHGRLDQAASHYHQAIRSAPDCFQAHSNLGLVLNHQGRPLEALDAYLHALSIQEAPEVKIGLAECLQRLRPDASRGKLRPLLTRAIHEAWRRPEELAPAAIAWLKGEPLMRAALSHEGPVGQPSLVAWQEDTLLLGLLENATVCDVAVERWLTKMRAALLGWALEQDAEDDASLSALQGALARQCFLNEYAWVISATEDAQLEQLQACLDTTLDSGGQPLAHQLLALASYRPLHTLAGPCFDATWPEALCAVLQQQVEEPRREGLLRTSLQRLTGIDEGVSCRVRRQYEENPYPRWARASLLPPPLRLDDRLRMQLPHARFQPMARRESLDVLIAGCGTGRHSTETASHYAGAHVLAIDLSASSLAYAMRKSLELGQPHIEYAQADILLLASLERRFDLIESVGVLHHLDDPEKGWRALLSLLRPGGLMRIGLYSELARSLVVAARQFIAERRLPATAQGIRACREALLNGDCPDVLKPLTSFGDFYGLSACRDLLFHEQEHRTSLPQIQALLDRLGLSFVGMHVEPAVLSRFRKRFPEEDAVHDLQRWHTYETEHPDTFIGMYQFWVQAPGSPAPGAALRNTTG